VAQTAALEPRTGQYPLLLRVDVPRQTPDGQQFAYNIVSRALASTRVAAEANTVITVAAPRVRVRVEMAGAFEPGESSFYRLVLVNDGGGLAKNLVLTEVLAETLQFISSEPRLDASDAAGGGRRVVWRVAELAPGDTTILRITARLGANLPPTTDVSASRTLSYQDTNGNTYAPGDGAGASVKLPAPGANAASVEPPSDAEQAMFGRGQTLYNQGRYEQSIAAFSDLLKTYPNSSITDLTLLWLGRAYIATGRLLNAEQLGERLRSIKNSPFIEIYQNELAAARKAATPKDVPAAKPEGLRTTPERAPATPRPAQELKRVYSVSSSDAPAGSRVTITAGDPLADYSAYRSGDRFYVVIPQATAAPRMLPLRPGRGFDNMQIQLRGQDVIFSFKLQPGASARVEQQFNRLVVQFSVPNK
jgi:tetratricopeptide (TPR) repeat protein